jgi:hypothetical protein
LLLWLDTANYGTYISTLEYFCQEQMLMISASEMIVAILINFNFLTELFLFIHAVAHE